MGYESWVVKLTELIKAEKDWLTKQGSSIIDPGARLKSQ
jgi:hypothetical protein